MCNFKEGFRDLSILNFINPLSFKLAFADIMWTNEFHSTRAENGAYHSIFKKLFVTMYRVGLDGEVEVETSGGEKQIFKKGNLLFATDITGQGHVTRTITSGTQL